MIDSPVPIYGDTNLAPARPFDQLSQQNAQQHYLQGALKERFGHFIKTDEAARNELIEVGQIVDEFISGRQVFGVNPYTGELKVLPIRRHDSSTQRALNVMQSFTTKNEEKWMASNPEVRAYAGADNDESEAAAYGAQAVCDFYEDKFYDEDFQRLEANLAMRWGTYITRVWHDPGSDGFKAMRNIVGEVPATFGVGAGYCTECKYKGAAVEFQQAAQSGGGEQSQGAEQVCPRCGSPWVMVQPAPQRNVPSVIGQEQVNLGDLRIASLLLPAAWWNLKFKPEHSDYFIYRQRIPAGEIKRLLGGNVKLPGASGRDNDKGLDVVEALARQGMPLGGKSRVGRNPKGGWQDQVTLDEMWLQPSAYADIELKGDERTLAGIDLPLGTKLVDLFPDGLVAVGLNGMQLVLGLYGEKHADHLSTGVWHMRPHSGAGRGVVDTVETQMRINQNDTQIRKAMDAATPGGFYDASLVSDEEVKLAFRPGVYSPVDLTKFPGETKALSSALWSPPTNLGGIGALSQYGHQFLKEVIQLQFHIADSSTGVYGMNPQTATGTLQLNQLGNSLFTPLLKGKGGQRKRTLRQTVNLYVKHIPVAQWIPLKNKYGTQQGLMLKGADLAHDLRYAIAQDSEAPRDIFTKRQETATFLEKTVGQGGLPVYLQLRQQFPAEMGVIERRFGFDLETDNDVDVISMRCGVRVKQATQAVMSGVMMPQDILRFIQPPPTIGEPRHAEKAKWYSDWLDTDKGIAAPLPLRVFVEYLAGLHIELGAQQKARIDLATAQAQASVQQVVGAMMGAPQTQQPQSPQQEGRAA